MTSYETVFKRFENKVEDIKVLKLASDDWTELCLEWLNSAIAMIELDKLKIEHDLTKKMMFCSNSRTPLLMVK